MRTSKPIATISYNSESFLRAKLDELVRNHKISDYIYIYHYAEQDERKNHFHVWVKPNTLLDTMDLQQFFCELDPSNPKKPLKCIDFVTSKVDDFILYTHHLDVYLASKGEAREFAYLKTDFRYYDEDSFENLYNHALKGSEWAKRYQLLQQLRDNAVNPSDLILNGQVPLNMAANLSAFNYMRLNARKLDRGDHQGHE